MRDAITYWLTGVLLFSLLPLTVMAGIINYSNLPDSSRLQIRLKSFLLVQPENKLPDYLFSSGVHVPIAFIYDGNHKTELMEKIRFCSLHQHQILLILKNNPPVPDNPGSEIIIINFDEIDSLSYICDKTVLQDVHSSLSKNELLRITIRDLHNCKDACFELWDKTGKLPNLISVDPSGMEEAANILSALNSSEKIYGATLENGQLLPEVYWENNPGARTFGYFCFPLTETNRDLIPYKAGYRFSPGIIRQSTRNWYDMKIFRSITYEPHYGLESHFTFRNTAKNENWKSGKGMINHHVKFRKERRFGWVAYFEDRAYIDAGPQSTGILNSVFSIITWVKLGDPQGKNSIIGKGRNFNLAIYQGKLTFSVVSDEVDYISEKSPVPVGEWTQVAVVYSKLFKRMDFYLNGKLTDQIDLISEYKGSDHTLLIGNNLWEEFFTGEIGEIKIWDRELDKDEIFYHYLNPPGKRNIHVSILILLFIVLTGTIAFFISGKLNRQKKHHDPLKGSQKSMINTGSMTGVEKIICFGGLKVIDSAENDICLRFSPKLKQIFSLILLYSQDNNKGITSKQLAGILWPGTSVANTKNLRSTYMQHLRSALSSFKNIKLVFNNKKWFFEFTGNFINEYSEIENILPQMYKEEDLKMLEMQLPLVTAILKKGPFLYGMEESWLDHFIEKMNNQVIEFCLKMLSVLDDTIHSVLILDLADIISMTDPLNEPALQKKINVLIKQGKLSLAKNMYDNFVKLYKELYKENYPADFKDLTSD